MGSPPNKTVQIFSGLDIKVDINSMNDLFTQNILYHLFFQLASTSRPIIALNSSWMPGYIAVLAAA